MYIEQYVTMEVLIPIAVAAVGYLIYKVVFGSKRRVKAGGEQAANKQPKEGSPAKEAGSLILEASEQPITAMVYRDNPLPRRRLEMQIKPETQKKIIETYGTLGVVKSFYGKGMVALHMDDKGKLGLIEDPWMGANSHPRQFYINIDQAHVSSMYEFEDERNFMEKWGKWIWWLAVMSMIMFMVISSIRG